MFKTAFKLVTKNNDTDIYTIRLLDKNLRVLTRAKVWGRESLKKYLTQEELSAMDEVESNINSRQERKKIKDKFPYLLRFKKCDKFNRFMFSAIETLNNKNFRYSSYRSRLPSI